LFACDPNSSPAGSRGHPKFIAGAAGRLNEARFRKVVLALLLASGIVLMI